MSEWRADNQEIVATVKEKKGKSRSWLLEGAGIRAWSSCFSSLILTIDYLQNTTSSPVEGLRNPMSVLAMSGVTAVVAYTRRAEQRVLTNDVRELAVQLGVDNDVPEQAPPRWHTGFAQGVAAGVLSYVSGRFGVPEAVDILAEGVDSLDWNTVSGLSVMAVSGIVAAGIPISSSSRAGLAQMDALQDSAISAAEEAR